MTTTNPRVPALPPRAVGHASQTTARDVLLLSPLDLMELLGLTWTAAHQLLADVSAQISPPYSTVRGTG